MRRSIRPVIALMVDSPMVMAAAACSGGDENQDSTSPSPGAKASGTVIWWGWTPDTPVAQKYIAEFNKVYPNITIKYTNYENADYAPTMSTAFQTGAGP